MVGVHLERNRGARELLWQITFLLALTGFSGCATNLAEKQERQVAQRAAEWADALMATNYEAAMSYMTPAYQKSPRSRSFAADFDGTGWWKSVQIKNVSCDNKSEVARCDVRMMVETWRPPAVNTPISIPYDTVWLNLGDEWYCFRD